MPDDGFTTVFLGDNSLSFVTQKTGWTKAEYRTMNTGNADDYPVYTATQKPVAYVAKQSAALIQASNDQPIISFGANGDGSAGTNFVYHVKPFYVSNDRTCIKVVNELIKPLYIYYKLLDIKKTYGFGFNYKATPQNVSLVSVEIPRTENGQFDLNAQQEAINSFRKHEQIKKALADQKERISKALVSIEMQMPFREEALGDNALFDLITGKRELKKDAVESGIPVYSANVRKSFGFTSKTIVRDFSIPSLIWGIDGGFDWNLIPKNTPFMPTDHCGVLRVRHTAIYPAYVYHVLRATKERYGFDRTFRANLNNIKTVKLPIPIKDGNYDFEAQVELARKYEKIENTKRIVVDAMDHIIDSIISS